MAAQDKGELMLDARSLLRIVRWPERCTDRGWRPYQPRSYPYEHIRVTEEDLVSEEVRRG